MNVLSHGGSKGFVHRESGRLLLYTSRLLFPGTAKPCWRRRDQPTFDGPAKVFSRLRQAVLSVGSCRLTYAALEHGKSTGALHYAVARM
jgi:hypothetical protein